MILEKTFGEKLEDITYRERIGVYAIILKNDKYAAVKIPRGYFLIGGGVKEGETHKDCLKRECLEETGLDINVGELICKGDNYDYVDKLHCYMHLTAYFYEAKINGYVCDKIEENHELMWLNIDDCYDDMFLKLQAWAVEKSYCINLH